MILEEALTVGLISIEDLQKMRDGFFYDGPGPLHCWKKSDQSFGAGTII